MSLQEYLCTGSSKVTSCGVWQKRVRLPDLLDGGLTVLQELVLPSLLMFLGSCWVFSHHAKSCRSMRNHALSARIMQFRAMVLLGFPTDSGRISQRRKGPIFLCVCCAPTPLISMLLLRCATVEFFKLCLQPPQGGHAMKQQAEIRCDHNVCKHRQISLWDPVNSGKI